MIDEQSIEDLEFDVLRRFLANYCKSEKAKINAGRIKPLESLNDVKNEFSILEEIQAVYLNDDISFPHASSEDIDHALKVLRVENGVLILDELVRVFKLCLGTEVLIKFAKKHKDNYPKVFEACVHIDSVQELLKIIRSVLNKKLEIDNNASPDLAKIRAQLKSHQKAINSNFESALRQYKKEDFLDVTEETYLDGRRLLVVISAHKRKVKGKVQGVSSKGAFNYIEPNINIPLNKELDQLRIDESNEVFKILQTITFELRGEKRNLEAFERLLIRFDLYNAKVQFAETYSGVIPKMNAVKKMYWEEAYHPILLLKNNELNLPTIGQDFDLKKEKRFLVISGPNAGGKSITLKTVGLLQIMFQSGLFVPVKDVSEFCWFNNILSDIGDNQSIDNQLSTYSYRLSRMKLFLNVVDEDSLILLDEFGSGSDPDLGGALAEVFYEDLYDKNCFAVINTHYTNIKILTSKKEEATNAFMLFDSDELKPLYKLSVGQPGSSFTFEVAELNGIGKSLIKRAQAKVSDTKVNLDNLASGLQKEKSDFNKANKLQNKTTNESRVLIKEYDLKLQDLYDKANQQHRFYEQQNKFVKVGKRVFELIGKHLFDESNKDFNLAIKKFVSIEKSRAKDHKDAPALDRKVKAPKIPKPAKKVVKEVAQEKPKNLKPIVVGGRVKIVGNSKSGIVESLDGRNAKVIVGSFRIKAKVIDLEAI